MISSARISDKKKVSCVICEEDHLRKDVEEVRLSKFMCRQCLKMIYVAMAYAKEKEMRMLHAST